MKICFLFSSGRVKGVITICVCLGGINNILFYYDKRRIKVFLIPLFLVRTVTLRLMQANVLWSNQFSLSCWGKGVFSCTSLGISFVTCKERGQDECPPRPLHGYRLCVYLLSSSSGLCTFTVFSVYAPAAWTFSWGPSFLWEPSSSHLHCDTFQFTRSFLLMAIKVRVRGGKGKKGNIYADAHM